ncbi:MAG: hypothetical protein IK115_04900 [Lachnospiraceae bacterium]|nr:hypothetical protein [Lachnospiraceae bacterium]
MSVKNVVILILSTLGAVLLVMGGHDLLFPAATSWAVGFEGTELYIFTGAGAACILGVVIIIVASAANHRLSSSVSAPVKEKAEYYGPGSDEFNGAFGDRAGGGADVHSMVKGAFASSAAVQPAAPVQPVVQPVTQQPVAVDVPVRSNEAVDPVAFAASRETPAGAAASANPLYGGIVETKKADYVSPYAGQVGTVNYDPAYANPATTNPTNPQ